MSDEPEIMHEKYHVRGVVGDSTITLEWIGQDGKKKTKPATPAEEHLTRQVNSLISALRVSMRRNAQYESMRGVHTPQRESEKS